MGKQTYDRLPPAPLATSVLVAAPRCTPDDQQECSAAFAMGHALSVKVHDMCTGRPLGYGGYVKSCQITHQGNTDEYRCKDADRYPRADYERPCYPEQAEASAYKRQKQRFYRYVSASLKRMGVWTGNITSAYSKALGEAIVKWYRTAGEEDIIPLMNETIKTQGLPEAVKYLARYRGLAERIEQALGGRDQVDGQGGVHIGLPVVYGDSTVTVRIEFQDVKFLKQDDVDEAIEEAKLGCPTGSSPAGFGTIIYDGPNGQRPANDPDLADNESTQEFSNWYWEVRGALGEITRKRFRNFADFKVDLKYYEPVHEEVTVYGLTWSQPVWFSCKAASRRGPDMADGQPVDVIERNTLPAVPTRNESSGPDYGIFGLFRSASPNSSTPYYRRLHPGIDIAGKKGETPVFAVHGGRFYGDHRIYHRDEQFTNYAHMDKKLAKNDQWVKAGTLIGIMGRQGFGGGTGQMPTHMHFETLIDVHTGSWPAPGNAGCWSQLQDGERKLRAAQYSAHQDVWKRTAPPLFVKSQYSEWARDPTSILRGWVEEQSGGGFDIYGHFLPRNWPAMVLLPCGAQYDATSSPAQCTCKCAQTAPNGTETLNASQIGWAKSCWAIRTSRDSAKCACPAFRKDGPGRCFAKHQRIQYYLWKLDLFAAAFDGKLTGGVRTAILDAAPWLTLGAQLAGEFESRFMRLVEDTAVQIVTDLQNAENRRAARQRRQPQQIELADMHRMIAIQRALNTEANVDILLEELTEAIG